MRAPFPYAGGKLKAAPIVWRYFGQTTKYFEPFAGSLAMLLSCPFQINYEVVGDYDCSLINVWRALRDKPGEVADAINATPKFSIDVWHHSRAAYLDNQSEDHRQKFQDDLSYCDVEKAAFWILGHSLSIAGFGMSLTPLGLNLYSGKGVVSLGRRDNLEAIFGALSRRLRHVIIYARSWDKVLMPGGFNKKHITSVFLDPPYLGTERQYREKSTNIAKDVEAWCLENGDKPYLRICLAGQAGDYDLPGWYFEEWVRDTGRSNFIKVEDRQTDRREGLWFSPHCRKPSKQGTLF